RVTHICDYLRHQELVWCRVPNVLRGHRHRAPDEEAIDTGGPIECRPFLVCESQISICHPREVRSMETETTLRGDYAVSSRREDQGAGRRTFTRHVRGQTSRPDQVENLLSFGDPSSGARQLQNGNLRGRV